MSPTFFCSAAKLWRLATGRRIAIATAFAAVWTVAAVLAAPAASAQDDDALWQAAEQRIERYRKADATIQVIDQNGPISGAQVSVQQTRHAFLFGCNIFAWGRVGDERLEAEYRRQFAEVFNFATLPFYWPSYEPQQGEPAHERTEQIAQWCREQGIRCKGHPLAWNYSEPRWLPDDQQQILALQLERIDDCVTRFRDLIGIWDVVNEATHFDRAEFVRRAPKFTAMWSAVGQVEFTRKCFLAARQANPDATLLINDYRTDTAYARLIEQLVDDRGQHLYDVIGIQSHQHGGAWSNQKIWEVCERFASYDVALHFTETTIVSGRRGWQADGARRDEWPSTEQGEAEQAREVERFYTMLYSHPAVEALTWWDFSDRHAWQSAPAGFVRQDMTPKPAYHVLKQLIKDRWWTRENLDTDARGQASFRGTLGEYRITVQVDGQAVAEQTMRLERDAANQLVIKLDR
jgi:GH35 family endo-1,4-beta-xylanase